MLYRHICSAPSFAHQFSFPFSILFVFRLFILRFHSYQSILSHFIVHNCYHYHSGTKRSGRFENQKDGNCLEEEGREKHFLDQHGKYMSRNGAGSTDKRFEKSIWQRMHENGNGPLQAGGVPMVIGKVPGDSWRELKLALSYPTTKRDSTLKSSTLVVLPGPKGDGIDRDSMPDSVRIAADLERDIKEMALYTNQRENKRQSLAGKLLVPENKHNLENNSVYKATRGLDNSIKMLKTLGTGKGTKTMLLMKNEEIHQKNIIYKSLKLNNSESQNLISLEEQKKRGNKIKVLSEKLLPLIKGIDRNTVMDLYLNKFCVDEVNENTKKSTVTFHDDVLQDKKKNW
jgi:hypothetical protein